MLPAAARLRRSEDFRQATRGRRVAGTCVTIHATRRPDRHGRSARVGFVVSKAVGTAVVRNKVKRRLRHQMADRLGGVPRGVDLVVRANPSAAHAPADQLGAEIDRLLGRLVPKLTRDRQPGGP